MSSRRVRRNAAQCLSCGDIVESVHRHDFKECSCKNIFVDGGQDYQRLGSRNGPATIRTLLEDPDDTGMDCA